MDGNAFSKQVQTYLRVSGHSQHHLANALGLHPGVLNRKLRGSGNAYLNLLEVKRITLTLINWKAITTQSEVLHFLSLANVKQSSFTEEEWQTAPLSQLEADHRQPIKVQHSCTQAALHNLPAPLTRLIGREWLVERLRQLLGREEVREVTLIGTGGSGKTRLALHVAKELLAVFPHGAWFVALDGVSDPNCVLVSICQTLGVIPTSRVSPFQSLIAYLKDKKLLLVLDGFEQVAKAAPYVCELLEAVRGLKILITSRVVMHLYGEHEFSVPPLDIPNLAFIPAAAELEQYSAVELFLERARAVVPDFALTAENGACIAHICAWLDGLPLALELAAARVKLLSPALLLKRLSEARLNLLTGGANTLPGRQRALRHTFEWSYNLLSSAEQLCFSRLGVFCGGWSLEAAEELMRGTIVEQETSPAIDAISTLDKMGKLVDSSLLIRQQATNGQVRFTMLKTIREYALECQLSSDEFEKLRDWHAFYYLNFAEIAEKSLADAQQSVWLDRLEIERENLQAALEWSLYRAKDGKIISSHKALELTEKSFA